MYSVYRQTSETDTHKFKVVELPKEIEEYVREKKGSLQFKAPTSTSNHLVLCTDDKTFTVRQMNHSNAVLLTSDLGQYREGGENGGKIGENGVTGDIGDIGDNRLLSYACCGYQYELSSTDGYIETKGVAIWEGVGDIGATKSLAQVEADSPIDAAHFLSCWYNLCGCEVDGKAVILAPAFVTRCLHELITVMIAEKLSEVRVSVEDVVAAVEAKQKTGWLSPLTPAVITTLCHKFGSVSATDLSLDHEKCAWWFGIECLKTASPQALSDNELMLKWKLSLPAFFSASLDLAALRGFFYRPEAGKIRYLNASVLSNDLHSRIKELLSMLKQWEYDEFLPYIKAFIPANKKADSVILKFARKKKVGKRYVIGPR